MNDAPSILDTRIIQSTIYYPPLLHTQMTGISPLTAASEQSMQNNVASWQLWWCTARSHWMFRGKKWLIARFQLGKCLQFFLCPTKSARCLTLIGQREVAKAFDWLIEDHLCDFEILIFSENLWKRQTSSMITLMRYREALFSYHHFPERAKNLHLYSLARSERCQDQSNLSDLAPSADWAVSFNPRTYFRSTRL